MPYWLDVLQNKVNYHSNVRFTGFRLIETSFHHTIHHCAHKWQTYQVQIVFVQRNRIVL